MDVEGDVHRRHAARGEVYVQRSGPRKPLAGAGVGGTYSSGEQGSGLVYPGYGNTGPTHEKRVHVPGRAYSVLELPECA